MTKVSPSDEWHNKKSLTFFILFKAQNLPMGFLIFIAFSILFFGSENPSMHPVPGSHSAYPVVREDAETNPYRLPGLGLPLLLAGPPSDVVSRVGSRSPSQRRTELLHLLLQEALGPHPQTLYRILNLGSLRGDVRMGGHPLPCSARPHLHPTI